MLQIAIFISENNSGVNEKTQLLQKTISEYHKLSLKVFFAENIAGVCLPFDPLIKVYDIVTENCFVFKSAIKPIKLTFKAKKFHNWKLGD